MILRDIAAGAVIFAMIIVPLILAGAAFGAMFAVTTAWPTEHQRKRMRAA